MTAGQYLSSVCLFILLDVVFLMSMFILATY